MKKRWLLTILFVSLVILCLVVFGLLNFYKKSIQIQSVVPVIEIKDRKPTQSEINKALDEVASPVPLTSERQKEINKALESVRGTTSLQAVSPNSSSTQLISPEQRKRIEAAMREVAR